MAIEIHRIGSFHVPGRTVGVSDIPLREEVLTPGGPARAIDLPSLGIPGNSHFLMMDDNSDEFAALVQDWIESKGLMR